MSHRRRFARSMKAAMAAFLLGRHAEDSGGGLADAQLWYASYMREAPGGPLAGEALGRQMVVLEKLGRTAEAKEAAKRYVMRFEGGSYEPVARTLLQGR